MRAHLFISFFIPKLREIWFQKGIVNNGKKIRQEKKYTNKHKQFADHKQFASLRKFSSFNTRIQLADCNTPANNKNNNTKNNTHEKNFP